MGVYFTAAGTQAGERTNQHCVGGRGDFICMFFEMGDFYADTGSPKNPTNFFVVARLAPLSLFLSLSLTKKSAWTNVKPLDMEPQILMCSNLCL